MKKIRIALATFAAIIGIGGAYAATHQDSSRRNATLFNWYTFVHFNRVYTHKSIQEAESLSGCNGVGANCMYGTVTDPNGVLVYTINKR
ncbi:hypothetical protein HHL17_19365 [Chitinophaga sp. G-6-1-13]|uniref:Uncharacterized protein n=1 Tax=Chitinophaga fulva TaxID=2728842 RepID=A0A848GUF7_9BACT|nr:hypothetical protein [Chitinophaga fulva]NML39368.1 hypothetical protein [Chitinophaga fulva]